MANVNRVELLEVLRKVSRAVPVSSNDKSKTVLLEIGDGQMKISATNLSTSIIGKIPCDVAFDKKMKLICDAKMFLDIVSKTNSEDLAFSFEENTFKIKSNKSTFKIAANEDVTMFPIINREEGNKNKITLSAEILKEIVNKTVKFASDDEARPVLGAVKFVFSKNKVLAVSLDGFRLAYYTSEIESEIEEGKEVEILIAASTLSNIAKAVNIKDITIGYNDPIRIIEFDLGDTSIYTSILDGEYFNYKAVVKPEDYKTKTTINRKDLKSAIERVGIVATGCKPNSPVVLDFKDENLTISTKNETGEVTEVISLANIEGEKLDMKFGFNHIYLLDGINVISSDNIEIRLEEALKPIYLMDENSDYLYFTLPLRLSND